MASDRQRPGIALLLQVLLLCCILKLCATTAEQPFAAGQTSGAGQHSMQTDVMNVLNLYNQHMCTTMLFTPPSVRSFDVTEKDVLFLSKSVAVLQDKKWRVMLSLDGHGGDLTCQEQSEVRCLAKQVRPSGALVRNTARCPLCNADTAPPYSYTQTMLSGALKYCHGCSAAPRMVAIGMGTGAIHRWLSPSVPSGKVESVDINPDVFKASVCFDDGHLPDRTTATMMDGRLYLEGLEDKSVDMLLIDAFVGEAVPPCLSTVDFFNMVRAKMADNGAVAINLWGGYEGMRVRNAMHAALTSKTGKMFKGRSPGLGNEIYVAQLAEAAADRETSDGFGLLTDPARLEDARRWLKSARFAPVCGGGDCKGADWDHQVCKEAAARKEASGVELANNGHHVRIRMKRRAAQAQAMASD